LLIHFILLSTPRYNWLGSDLPSASVELVEAPRLA